MSIRLNKDMIGKKVKLVKIINKYNPDKIGAIGYITSYDEGDEDNKHYLVEWQVGSKWESWPRDDEIEEVKENNQINCTKDMTNEEIWKMLEGKMRKNGLKPCGFHLLFTGGIANAYAWEDVHNAIALAYKVGYLRSQKGRPFKIGEKKKKGGHWEPVDPNNLPKEGTKVRYAREDKEYKEIPLIALGDSGTFALGKVSLLPGIKFDDGRFWDWICFNGAEDCLDMWVEDDE